jgi:hypothetical protein
MHPVTGEVTFNGKAYEGLAVSFMPERPENMKPFYMANGFSDKEGKFNLKSAEGEGIAAGKYKVTFSLLLLPNGTPMDANSKPNEVGAKQVIPQEWTLPNSTPETVEVKPGANHFTFALKSHSGK